MDSNLTFSLIKMMDSFFEPFVPRDVSIFVCHFSIYQNIGLQASATLEFGQHVCGCLRDCVCCLQY